MIAAERAISNVQGFSSQQRECMGLSHIWSAKAINESCRQTKRSCPPLYFLACLKFLCNFWGGFPLSPEAIVPLSRSLIFTMMYNIYIYIYIMCIYLTFSVTYPHLPTHEMAKARTNLSNPTTPSISARGMVTASKSFRTWGRALRRWRQRRDYLGERNFPVREVDVSFFGYPRACC